MSKGSRPALEAPARVCTHCGAQLSGRGQRSKTGDYYCAAKPECRRAKQRALYASRYAGSIRADAPTVCHCCGDAMPPRKVRHGDSPIGRWCQKSRCQRERVLLIERAKQNQTSDEVGNLTALVIEFIAAIESKTAVVECPACHLEDAVEGFIHPYFMPNGRVDICHGTPGNKDVASPVKKELAQIRWPEFFEPASNVLESED